MMTTNMNLIVIIAVMPTIYLGYLYVYKDVQSKRKVGISVVMQVLLAVLTVVFISEAGAYLDGEYELQRKLIHDGMTEYQLLTSKMVVEFGALIILMALNAIGLYWAVRKQNTSD